MYQTQLLSFDSNFDSDADNFRRFWREKRADIGNRTREPHPYQGVALSVILPLGSPQNQGFLSFQLFGLTAIDSSLP